MMKQYMLGAILGMVMTTFVSWAIREYRQTIFSLQTTQEELGYVRKIIMDDEYRMTNRRSDNDRIVDMVKRFEVGGLNIIWHTKDDSFQKEGEYSLYNFFSLGTGYEVAFLDQNILFHEVGKSWIPWFSVHDNEKSFDSCQRKNRPVAFTSRNNKLILTLVNACGGGSGEGYVSTYELQANGKRALNGCYNYAHWDPFQELAPEEYKEKWYAWGTTQFDQLPKEELGVCDGNVMMEYYLGV